MRCSALYSGNIRLSCLYGREVGVFNAREPA
jgi:hypothetical protein